MLENNNSLSTSNTPNNGKNEEFQTTNNESLVNENKNIEQTEIAENQEKEIVQNKSENIESENTDQTKTASSLSEDNHELIEQKQDVVKNDKAEKETLLENSENNAKTSEQDNEIEDDSNATEEDYSTEELIETYANFNREALYNELKNILETVADKEILKERPKIEYIKALYYKQSRHEYEKNLQEFLKENPEALKDDYKPEDDTLTEDFKAELKRYREKKEAVIKADEEEKAENLAKRKALLEDLQELIKGEETLEKTYNEFQTIQEKWRSIGKVAPQYTKQIWNDYHHHVQNFYEWVKLNKEAKEVDLKKNLEAKIDLCEKAEELLLEKSINAAFEKLQELHEKWRETGPVDRDKNDEIWERFKKATTEIHKKRQEHFEKIKEEQENNYLVKAEMCEKVEKISAIQYTTHKEWKEKTDEIVKLQETWRTIGFAPKNVNNQVWKRFRQAIDLFFENKSIFYKEVKENQEHNLNLKQDIVAQVESLKDSSDWKSTTEKLIQLQKEWKKIGPVPKKQSDAIWKKFRTANDVFFSRKEAHFAEQKEKQDENLNQKYAILEELDNFDLTMDQKESLNKLKEIQRRWMEIGFVPFNKKEEINQQFKDKINAIFDKLKLDSSNVTILKYKNTIETYKSANDGGKKLKQEKQFIQKKIADLEANIQTLDNNIGFFANSKNADVLKVQIEKKIAKAKEELMIYKEKLKVLN